MNSEQIQIMIDKRIDTKLDKIARLLDAILVKMDTEPELDKKTIKKIAKEWKDIESGKVKLHRYNDLKEFDKALSKMG